MTTDTPNEKSKTQKGLRARFRPSRDNLLFLLISALILVYLLVAAVFSFGIYRSSWSGTTTRTVSRFIPFPAAIVRGDPVFYHTFLREVSINQKSLETSQKVNFSSKEGRSRLELIKGYVLSQVIDNKLIEQEASKRQLRVSDKEIQDRYKQLLDSNGGEAKVKKILSDNFGMTIPEFKKRVREGLLKEKVQTAFAKDTSIDTEAKKRIEEVKKQLGADGSNFAELAQKYSEDTSASQGGDLGLAGRGKYVPEFEKAAFTLEVGKISDPVKTQFGYHLIQVLEKKEAEVHVRHILIKTVDFQTWLGGLRCADKVSVYIEKAVFQKSCQGSK